MSRSISRIFLAGALAATAFAPATFATDAPDATATNAVDLGLGISGPGVFISENIEYIATIPLDAPGVGGKFIEVEGTTYYFLTGEKGLTIYDVTNPELPAHVSTTPFPHSQNEDVSVAADGRRVVISADGGLPAPVLINQGVHVFDTSDLSAPKLLASASGSTHTTECADPSCHWLYTSTGRILDATRADEGIIEDAGLWSDLDGDGKAESLGTKHALHRDEAGYVISDTQPRLVFDPRPHTGADGTEYDYANPELITKGAQRTSGDTRLQHNNIRPSSLDFVSRDASNPADAFTEPVIDPTVTNRYSLPEGSLRAGELLVANSESNVNPTCNMSGALATWDMRDFDKGRAPVQLDIFHPASGTWADGSPALAASGCSGHWFDVSGEYIAASWYEHGVRVFHVGLDTGALTEVGFFQTAATIAGQSQWHIGEDGSMYIYAADYARGLDILKFDPEAPRPSDDERLASWFAGAAKAENALVQQLQYACRLGAGAA